MYKKLLFIVALSQLLSGCFLTPPSRSYSENPLNITLVKAETLNIDLIKPMKVEVESSKSWQNTGVFVENGDIITVNASGSWSPAPALMAWSGPEGNGLWAHEVPGITGGALMAKLGHHGHPFEIGISQTFRAEDYGMLYFAMNDPFRYVFDNSGKVVAEIHTSGANHDTKSRSTQTSLKIVAYSYDEKTGKGSLAAEVGTEALSIRQRLINKIGEIASSKNVALQAGRESLKGGNYELLGESSRDGILELKFRTLW
ncbi:MAG: hypothetical protein EP315_07275 [Gammaproteobacteria bacterium]|nr:MAG: hypothetical protein EP315_07275 [Gammaproteobacteria bacterium]